MSIARDMYGDFGFEENQNVKPSSDIMNVGRQSDFSYGGIIRRPSYYPSRDDCGYNPEKSE